MIRKLSVPLRPIPCEIEPRLAPLSDIRCLAFDVYGTLLMHERQATDHLIDELRPAYHLPQPKCDLQELVHLHHLSGYADGIEHPEVDIRDLWSEVFDGFLAPEELERFALEYEMRANHVAAMPGLRLKDLPTNLTLACLSNAQFYTPLIMDEFLDFQFEPDLQLFSYEYRRAKPDLFLFEKLRDRLAKRDISPHETLFIGNNHYQDILPASEIGFKSALFAGDQRTFVFDDILPLPDLIFTDLAQLHSLF